MEVTAKLQFTLPCLGNVRKPDFDRMERDQDGIVIFLPTWWRSAFAKAAKAINHYHDLVNKIHPALPIFGPVTRVPRRYGRKPQDIKVHEGFAVGATVECSFLLPSEMTANQFTELLEAVGNYIGISPYGWKSGKFGFFKVLGVRKGGSSSHQKSGQPPSGDT